MKLTRMQLDKNCRDTMKAFTHPNLIHGALESAFDGERQHPLWRIDAIGGKFYLLIVSKDTPDLTEAVRQFGCTTGENQKWQSKDYDVLLSRIENGKRYRFRLVANPTYHDKGNLADKTRGKVHAHSTLNNQRRWFEQQSQLHGFSVSEDEYQVTGKQWFRFRKGKEGKLFVTLLSVAYEGILTVTDAKLFTEALCNGIGRGKAYGMGLMTVISINE